jgi:hypothetical protein
MLNNEPTQRDPDHLAEARASKRRVRHALQAMIDEHLVVDPLLLDAALEESLFADLPWRDPSPSGEFEAIQA